MLKNNLLRPCICCCTMFYDIVQWQNITIIKRSFNLLPCLEANQIFDENLPYLVNSYVRNKRCLLCLHGLMQTKGTLESTWEQISASPRPKVESCTCSRVVPKILICWTQMCFAQVNANTALAQSLHAFYCF